MNERPHILIVDDDRQIRTMLRRYLEGEQFHVDEAADGAEMRATLEKSPIELVLLDLTLPGEDGISLARHVRQTSSIPIIMLTGKTDVIDRVAGLEAGADDYIPKPFHLREVLARIRTVLRRSVGQAEPQAAAAPSASDEKPHILAFNGWRLDLTRRELWDATARKIELTTGEFELLRALALNANRVLNRDQLMDLVKGRDWAAYDRTIDTQIGRLRKKIEPDTQHPDLIKTVRGMGYIFAATVTSA